MDESVSGSGHDPEDINHVHFCINTLDRRAGTIMDDAHDLGERISDVETAGMHNSQMALDEVREQASMQTQELPGRLDDMDLDDMETERKMNDQLMGQVRDNFTMELPGRGSRSPRRRDNQSSRQRNVPRRESTPVPANIWPARQTGGRA